MRPASRAYFIWVAAQGLPGCRAASPIVAAPAVEAERVRVATWNVSLYRAGPGQLAAELEAGSEQAEKIARVLAKVRPDVLLLNEIDHEPDDRAVRLLIDRYLTPAGLRFPHHFAGPVNTGVPTGVDLDRDGVATTTPGTRGYGGDCRGYGVYPGQYGMALLSRFPLGRARTFRELLWRDVPGAVLPDDPATPAPADWYSPAALAVLPLSSKSHWDVPVEVGIGLHVLASHPTPPVFDGPEDRNGLRNAAEIALWTSYISGEGWMVDDQGARGGLGAAPFVVLGDLNNDLYDGDGRHAAIAALLDHPRVQRRLAPASPGGLQQAIAQGGSNPTHRGPPQADTLDLDNEAIGNLRLDYVLPSQELQVVEQGVFWPRADDPDFALVGLSPFPISDHRLVWVDVRVPLTPR